MKARYLTFFSYLGNNFRSSEKLWLKNGSTLPDPESVQGMIELGLLKFKSLNYPKITLSSRTDGGVHAIQNAAHFDLEKYGPDIHSPESIVLSLNRFFSKNNTSICVRQCLRVCDDFSARFQAKSRSYLYRFAVLKPEIPVPDKFSVLSYAPIEEWKRCHFVFYRNAQLDIERMRSAARLLEGYHDFSTFKKFDKLLSDRHSRRELTALRLSPGASRALEPGPFDYWDVTVTGRSFVHNQIRRMIGVLLAVGLGKLHPADVKVMLQVPSKHSWPSCASSLPPDGLHLLGVDYDPEDLVYRPEGLRSKGDDRRVSATEGKDPVVCE